MSMSTYNAQRGTITISGDGLYLELDLTVCFPMQDDKLRELIILIDAMPIHESVKRQCYKQMIIYLNQAVNNTEETRYKELIVVNIIQIKDFIYNQQQ